MMLHKLKAMRDRWRIEAANNRKCGYLTRALTQECDADELDALIQECEGWVCVPREPTKEVIDAIADAHDDRGIVDRLSARELYDLILTVAPKKE